MRQRIAASLFVLGALYGCSPSRAALISCTLPDGGADGSAPLPTPCPAPLTCAVYYALGPDGLCHGVIGGVCALPCQSNADCAALGANSVCYSCPSMPGVCTAFQ